MAARERPILGVGSQQGFAMVAKEISLVPAHSHTSVTVLRMPHADPYSKAKRELGSNVYHDLYPYQEVEYECQFGQGISTTRIYDLACVFKYTHKE